MSELRLIYFLAARQGAVLQGADCRGVEAAVWPQPRAQLPPAGPHPSPLRADGRLRPEPGAMRRGFSMTVLSPG